MILLPSAKRSRLVADEHLIHSAPWTQVPATFAMMTMAITQTREGSVGDNR